MQKTIKYIIGVLLGTILLLQLPACVDDGISSDSNLKISFSADTIAFDTVFTTTTTATAKLKIYNRNNDNIIISSLWVGGKNNSPFKINVSGRSNETQSFSNIELRKNDSLYIYINVTINPNDQNSPVLITDSIGFLTNGNEQFVQLTAIGQDVILFKNKTVFSDSTLTADKPFLIFGNLTVNENITLTIAQGCKLYFHAKSGVEVYGNLNVSGTLHDPVLMRGDRIDYLFKGLPYDTLSGQWNGIRLLSENGVHSIEHLEMRSGTTAIHISGTATQPKLSIKNTTLHNFDSCAILARNAEVKIVNAQLSNCGVNNLFVIGGKVSVVQSTITNFYPISKRKGASVFLSNKNEDESVTPIEASIQNTIIIGNRNSEVSLLEANSSKTPTSGFNINFFNCLKYGKEEEDPFYINTQWVDSSKDIFVNTTTYPYNFHLKENSPAIGLADNSIASQYKIDKDGHDRFADGAPDIGAYEYVY
jgi:hypothetical protein